MQNSSECAGSSCRYRAANYCQRSSGRRKISFKITARRIPSPPDSIAAISSAGFTTTSAAGCESLRKCAPAIAERANLMIELLQLCAELLVDRRDSLAQPRRLVADLLHRRSDVLSHVLGYRLRAAFSRLRRTSWILGSRWRSRARRCGRALWCRKRWPIHRSRCARQKNLDAIAIRRRGASRTSPSPIRQPLCVRSGRSRALCPAQEIVNLLPQRIGRRRLDCRSRRSQACLVVSWLVRWAGFAIRALFFASAICPITQKIRNKKIGRILIRSSNLAAKIAALMICIARCPCRPIERPLKSFYACFRPGALTAAIAPRIFVSACTFCSL